VASRFSIFFGVVYYGFVVRVVKIKDRS